MSSGKVVPIHTRNQQRRADGHPELRSDYWPWYQYQRGACERIGKEVALPAILNVACKEDPADLGEDFGAINLDIEDYDNETGKNLYDLPNFVCGSALDLPFEANRFDLVVLGEFLEHCTPETASRALDEATHVAKPGGLLAMTFPLDARPKEIQRPPHELLEYCPGITSWHQTVWTDELLAALQQGRGLRLLDMQPLRYPPLDLMDTECWGRGMTFRIPGKA